tara:strand:- start:2930 stop:3166 length:237 start_codon:yes stop_codon:yes gene_type:complete
MKKINMKIIQKIIEYLKDFVLGFISLVLEILLVTTTFPFVVVFNLVMLQRYNYNKTNSPIEDYFDFVDSLFSDRKKTI